MYIVGAGQTDYSSWVALNHNNDPEDTGWDMVISVFWIRKYKKVATVFVDRDEEPFKQHFDTMEDAAAYAAFLVKKYQRCRRGQNKN